MRGSPHIHGIYWLENTPDYIVNDEDSIKRCTDFIDKFVTCEKNEQGKMSRLIGYQLHKHSHTCYKGHSRARCRFGFPKPPMPFTTILEPISFEFTDDEKKKFKEDFKRINNDLTERGRHPAEVLEFNAYLEFLELTMNEYILGILTSKKIYLLVQL